VAYVDGCERQGDRPLTGAYLVAQRRTRLGRTPASRAAIRGSSPPRNLIFPGFGGAAMAGFMPRTGSAGGLFHTRLG
jgi:hypothetical protein